MTPSGRLQKMLLDELLDAAGIAETGLERRSLLAVDHHHFMAGLRNIPGAGRSDHACAKKQNLQRSWPIIPS